VSSLLRHDWVHRLREIMAITGFVPTERLLDREARLRALADEIGKVPAGSA
jgi:hypothetical protein